MVDAGATSVASSGGSKDCAILKPVFTLAEFSHTKVRIQYLDHYIETVPKKMRLIQIIVLMNNLKFLPFHFETLLK